ncbi:hypothetical protein PAXINDRAFT_71852, partial [Paxillus involutus ATCC 200175]
GVSLLIDEVATDEAAVYFPQNNSVGGLSWKHVHMVNPVLHMYELVVNIAPKLKSGNIHLSKEMTVVGAHCFGEDGVYPLLAAPTCKMEDAADMVHIFNTVINAGMDRNAVNCVGPVTCVTCGDFTLCPFYTLYCSYSANQRSLSLLTYSIGFYTSTYPRYQLS